MVNRQTVAATIVLLLSSSEAQHPSRLASKVAKGEVEKSKASKKAVDEDIVFSLSMSLTVPTINDPSDSPMLQGLFKIDVNNPIVLKPEYAGQNSPQHAARYDEQDFAQDEKGNTMFLPMTIIVGSFLVVLGATATTLRVLRGEFDHNNDSSKYDKDLTAAIPSPIVPTESIVEDRVVWRPWGLYLDTIREEMSSDSDCFDEQSI
jgi:hypothetical protein